MVKPVYLAILSAMFGLIMLGCLTLSFSPILTHERDLMGNELVTAPAMVSIQGLAGMNEVWRTLPDYNIGIAIIGAFAVIGFLISGWLAALAYYQEKLFRTDPVLFIEGKRNGENVANL